jgi:tripartite-type tricarboxylate transporter receptor subunit TctC
MHKFLIQILGCLLSAGLWSGALAFPDRPLRILVPAAAGGGADILGRLLAHHMSMDLGQAVVVENRAGAGGNLAAEAVARASKDGYTLLLGDTAQLAINPALYRSIGFSPQNDFAPVARVASFPFLLIAHPAAGVGSVADVLSRARSRPGTVVYASAGVGTPQHLGGEMLARMSGVNLVHVPYRGGAPALNDLLSGQVPLGFVGIPPTLPHLKKGSLRALAVSSAARSPLLPDVPTMAESGVPAYDALVWFGLLAPAGVPEPVLHRLEDAVRTAMQRTEVRDRLRSMGFDPAFSGSAELAAYIRSEGRKWQDLVRASGATVD